jgi:peptide-methionine (S)-S-oxide reductase
MRPAVPVRPALVARSRSRSRSVGVIVASFAFAALGLSVAACKPAPSPDVREAPAPTQDTAKTGTGTPEKAHGLEAPAAKATAGSVGDDPGGVGRGTPLSPKTGNQLAEFAAGCFWGVEDAFRKVPGVVATAVGYTDGVTDAPTYETVCSHATKHAETVLVEFDPAKISYEKLLVVFFAIHDPTTVDRQGPDYGDQYRSAIFTFSDEQAKAARAAMAVDEAKNKRHDVTQVKPVKPFWKAEDYHQQYAEKTGSHGCPTGKIPPI